MLLRTLLLMLVASTSALTLAKAQTSRTTAPAAPAPAANEGPERTTAQFGDWTLVCLGRQGQRQCEVVQVVQDRERRASAAVAFGRTAKDQPLRLVLGLPVNATVAIPARLVLDGAEALQLPFRRCQPGSCFAELELRDDALRRLRARAAETPGRAEWRDAAGAEAGFAVSFRGMAAALDAMAREGG